MCIAYLGNEYYYSHFPLSSIPAVCLLAPGRRPFLHGDSSSPITLLEAAFTSPFLRVLSQKVPWPAANALPWGAGGRLCCKNMVMAHLRLGGHHNLRVLLGQAALQPVLVPGAVLPRGQDSAFSLFEVCVIPIRPFWTKKKKNHLPLKSHFASRASKLKFPQFGCTQAGKRNIYTRNSWGRNSVFCCIRCVIPKSLLSSARGGGQKMSCTCEASSFLSDDGPEGQPNLF